MDPSVLRSQSQEQPKRVKPVLQEVRPQSFEDLHNIFCEVPPKQVCNDSGKSFCAIWCD